MRLEDFFNLPESTQEEWVKAYRKRQQIISRKASYDQAAKELYAELLSVQEHCEHPLVIIKHTRDTDEYGKSFSSGVTQYECPDCAKRWLETWKD